jgi:hypothetical protein
VPTRCAAISSSLLAARGVSDWSGFPTEKQFVARATGARDVPKRGGQPVRKKKPNRASRRCAAAWRMAARSMRHSETALGAHEKAYFDLRLIEPSAVRRSVRHTEAAPDFRGHFGAMKSVRDF